MNQRNQTDQVHIALARSNTQLPFGVRVKMADLMLNLMRHRKKFGMFVILGWKTKWQRFADTPDASQDLFARRHINIMKLVPAARPPANTTTTQSKKSNSKKGSIVNTINFDGAILVDGRGNVLHSGTMIEGLRPRATAQKLNPRRTPDLSSQFGFKQKVHMRHIAAITSSYLFKGTTVFTISEETDDLHIFENGRIIYSSVRGEPTK